ncbi:DNA-binding transcriptional regulator [Aeoliella sp. ICT_H6.2]|uniref:DNA-binding transcriptional regulator n=1 Tax=Aeoliella straminimaris TaxID=2954799 RepID=A0A9X2F5Z7_9BACT|nr:DNA-binding transcriptional regulator [Aeoliella straminimaris]MCO6042399.1 DNA-binding transcriptional regulator [Aeoliella straminimaris]
MRIALLIDTSTTWGSGLIEGIVDYSKSRGKSWLFSFEPRGKYDDMQLPEGWQGDGVIARVTTAKLAEQIITRKIPSVNVSWFRYGTNLIPTCTCNEEKAAELAVQYFVGQGYRQFAYCRSTLRPTYFDRLGDEFERCIQNAGYRCLVFEPDTCMDQLDTEGQLMRLGGWLDSLPRPTALLSFDSIQGRLITEACHHQGISVPDDIAVLGGEHDELCSRVSQPPLSGIDQAPQLVGFHAAEMLDMQLNHRPSRARDQRLPPARIIARQSTDKFAIDDEMLAEAIRYIHANYAERLKISDILAEIPLSRRALEIGFRKYLGRTPRDEIRRVRLHKSLELLCDTDWSVTRIAQECGFDRPELYTRAFRREFKATPSQYRRNLAHDIPPPHFTHPEATRPKDASKRRSPRDA